MQAPEYVPMTRPRAITMWDFSWLERRWPGAGYEEIDRALDELAERGYDAVRIDAYPHLVLADGEAEYELLPVWSVCDWGAPMRCKVRVLPHLLEFIAACGRRGIAVGLSSWFRRDTTEAWRQLCTPGQHAAAWVAVLDAIRDAGLLQHILYVDLCNEWPLRMWAPFVYGQDSDLEAIGATGAGAGEMKWYDEKSLHWLRVATAQVQAAYPTMPITTSIHSWHEDQEPVADICDFFEPHIWMAGGDFYHRVGYTFQYKFDYSEFENVAKNAEKIYRADAAHWREHLCSLIDHAAAMAGRLQRPLMTTECWGIVDYIDAPLLNWGWVKELCALGTEHAVQSGAWAVIGTSNFCGPQFVGMWRDIEWHQRLTGLIRDGQLPSWSSKLTGVAVDSADMIAAAHA